MDLCSCALLSKFVLCSQHQAVPHSVGLQVTGWSISMWKSQEKMKHIWRLLSHVTFSVVLYLTKQHHSVKHFVLLLMSVSWKFQRCLNSNTQWSERHLSSLDIPEAMIYCGWFGTGWLIRYSLLLWPPVEVTSRVFAGYICVFIHSQIWIP